jgi:hypothetical protein
MVINKTGSNQMVDLALSGFTPAGAAQVYRYSSDNLTAIMHLADLSFSGGSLKTTLPPNSISLLIVP